MRVRLPHRPVCRPAMVETVVVEEMVLVSSISRPVAHYLRCCAHRVVDHEGGQDVFREELTMDPAVGRAVDGDDVSPIGAL